jgi:hypothetical protein
MGLGSFWVSWASFFNLASHKGQNDFDFPGTNAGKATPKVVSAAASTSNNRPHIRQRFWDLSATITLLAMATSGPV